MVPVDGHGSVRPTSDVKDGALLKRGELAPTHHPAFERHYRVADLAEIWQLGRETVRLLVKDEQGVIKVRLGRKRAHTMYSVPESVAVRIHTRLLNGR